MCPPRRDDLGAEELRASVLRAWRDSPTRLTEDTNAEHDLRVGAYRDRLFVELAQNAADAAALAGVPGRVRVSAVDGELRVANTGAPLDSAGVAALASLRASAKPEGRTVGRFGVGFAAVLAVCAEPRVVSRTGGVAFSARRTAEAIGADGPVLRLPWPLPGDEPGVPAGFDTEVRLPLDEGVAAAGLLGDIAAQVPDLLLALPRLAEVDVDGAVWRRAEHAGVVELTDPEARRHRWLTHAAGDVRWAVPVDGDGVPRPLEADVLHAPTPTDERLSLPARLIADVPIEPSRRRVRPGPELTAVLTAAAGAYPDLVRAVAAGHRLALVPATGFPLSEVDEVLRDLVPSALAERPWLPAAEGADLPGSRARVLGIASPALVEVLAGVVADLVAAPLCGPGAARVAAVAGARRVDAAGLVEAVTGVDRPVRWWRSLYDALLREVDAGLGTGELGALPVPLVDGRTPPGPRGALLLDGGDLAGVLSDVDVVGLRVVHPDAAHPLLERLGARRAGPAELLAAPELAEAVHRSVPDALSGMDVRGLAVAVLRLVTEAGGAAGLGALALPGEHGWRRADELVLPGAAMLDVLDPDALGAEAPLDVLAAEAAERWPAETLGAVGVLDGFAVVTDEDPAEPDHDLPEEADWFAEAAPGRVLAVRDLDLVGDECWPEALRQLAARPETWRALTEPGGHTGWWLARYALLAGRAPAEWRLPGAGELAGLYDPVPDLGVRADVLRAAGVRAGLAVTSLDDAADLADRLGDPGREVPPGLALRAHAVLADAGLPWAELDPPQRVRVLAGGVADAADALVLDRPWLLAVLPAARLVAVPDGADPAPLAELLDLPLASEYVRAEVTSEGEYVPWRELPAVVLAAELLDIPLPDGGVVLHERLTVTANGTEHDVPWWPAATPHAEDTTESLARALAWTTTTWPTRHTLTATLEDPTPVTLLT